MSFEQRPKCKICGALHFARDPHQFSGGSSAVEREPSKLSVEGSTPSRRSKEATTLRKDTETRKPAAGTQALPVASKSKRGRPATGFDKREYDRKKAADRRAKAKSDASR